MKTATYEGLDIAIYKCLKSASHRNVPVDGKVFKFKTLSLQKNLVFRNSKLQMACWTDKKRFNVSFETISGNF